MIDWHTMEDRPEGLFDVLARWYEPGMNRFILCRFTGCILQDLRILWCSPFQGETNHVDLEKSGYRVVAWTSAPGSESIPPWLEAFASGPSDRKGQP